MANLPLKIIQNSQRQMPCNIEAEQALIGSILVSNDIYDEITLIVNAQKFFDPIHAKIFDTIEMLISKGLLANPITLKNHFENNEGLKELGGQEYLIKITKFSTTSVKQAIDYANGVATDSSGNVYVAGATYGGLDGNSKKNSDLFVVKYNSSGTKQ